MIPTRFANQRYIVAEVADQQRNVVRYRLISADSVGQHSHMLENFIAID
jgi:hypothetical protein